MRREQTKHRAGMRKLKQFVGKTVVSKGKQMIDQQRRKTTVGPSYNAPTVLSRIRDGNSFERTRKSALDDSTLTLH